MIEIPIGRKKKYTLLLDDDDPKLEQVKALAASNGITVSVLNGRPTPKIRLSGEILYRWLVDAPEGSNIRMEDGNPLNCSRSSNIRSIIKYIRAPSVLKAEPAVDAFAAELKRKYGMAIYRHDANQLQVSYITAYGGTDVRCWVTRCPTEWIAVSAYLAAVQAFWHAKEDGLGWEFAHPLSEVRAMYAKDECAAMKLCIDTQHTAQPVLFSPHHAPVATADPELYPGTGPETASLFKLPAT